MKFSTTALSLALLLGADAHESRLSEIRANRGRLTKEFMDAMREPELKAARRKASAKKVRELNEGLMKASRKLAYQNGYGNGNGNYGGNNGGGNNMNGQYYFENGAATGYYVDGAYYPWEEAPFDMTSRSFKYSGCAAIKTYDEERAEETGNPMVIDTYAVFRLCPSDKCNDYSLVGCGKNYGEYAVEMKTYLSYVLGYYDNRFDEYCDYCMPCDWEYQAEAKTTLSSCYAQQAQNQYKEMQNYQDQQQQAMQGYVDMQNGNSNWWSWPWGNKNQAGAQAEQQQAEGQQQQDAGANNYANYNQYYGGNNGGGRKLEDGAADNAQYANYDQYAQYANNNNAANYNQGNNGAQGNYNQGNNGAQGNYNQGNNGAQGNYNQGNNAAAGGGNANYGYYDENGNWVMGDNMDWYWAANQQQNNNNQYWQLSKCQDGSSCDYCTAQNEKQYDYCDDYACKDYYTYCTDLYGVQEQFDPMDFLECQAFQNENGVQYYIGPHCGSDHYTISLGVFSDANCVDYIGDSVSLQTVLGFDYSDEDVFKMPKECISCDGAEEYENQQDENEGVYGRYVSAPETTEDGVVAMCQALYSGSAQCNMNMNNFEQISRYMSQYEIDQESRYCAFIENIIFGAYDESGEILLKPEQFDFSDWRNPQQYGKLKMPVGQALLLSASIILCVALLAVACFTNRQLTKQTTPWKPSREDIAIVRQNSGIVLGRSRSGPGAAPLI